MRRLTLPLRVLGSTSVKQMSSGLAMGPISWAICCAGPESVPRQDGKGISPGRLSDSRGALDSRPNSGSLATNVLKPPQLPPKIRVGHTSSIGALNPAGALGIEGRQGQAHGHPVVGFTVQLGAA